jgi:hypothetical protein
MVLMALLALLVLPASLFGFAAVAAVLPPVLGGLLNKRLHGLSDVLPSRWRLHPLLRRLPSNLVDNGMTAPW